MKFSLERLVFYKEALLRKTTVFSVSTAKSHFFWKNLLVPTEFRTLDNRGGFIHMRSATATEVNNTKKWAFQ